MKKRSTAAEAISTGRTRLSEPFRITILLDDHLTFHAHDVQAALAEDFPDMDWSGGDAQPDLSFDTAGVAAASLACGPNTRPAVVLGGGEPVMDWTPWFRRNRIAPSTEEAERMMASVAHLEISVGCAGTDLASRIDAARRATTIATVFAELPIVAGVAVGWCDRLMSAASFAAAADVVRVGRIPMLHWLHLVPFRDPAAPDHTCAVSIGLAPFFGVEVEARQSPEPQAQTLAAVYTAASRMLEQGRHFADGATMQGDETDYRIRHVPEGKLGNDTDRWTILHPDSPFRDRKLLGRAKDQSRTDSKDRAARGWLSKRVSGLKRTAAVSG